MSRLQGKRRDFGKTTRIFAEDETTSGDESGLDIMETTRKGLNISHFIDALTPSQSQSQHQKDGDQVASEEEISESEQGEPRHRPPPGKCAKDQKASKKICHSSDTADQSEDPESDGFDQDPTAAYREFKARKTQKRKRVAAETNRIRQEKKSRAAAAKSIIGRKPTRKAKKRPESNPFSSASEGEGTDGKDTYLDDPIPEYFESRKRKLKRLQDAGLRYPPIYDDIDLSDSDSEVRPVLHPDIKPQRAKKDIKLRESGGIIPANIAQWLRDYQVQGVQFLHENFVRQTGALLGDDMGLGKTIQVIAFLTAAFGKTAQRCDSKCMRKVRRVGDGRWYPRVLIVCPGTLMQNWEDELNKWGWWQVDRYHGTPDVKRGILGGAAKGMTEIMMTTYDTYRNHEGEINTINWDCIIADECHIIKNKHASTTIAMNKVNALCRIGLTGTAIQNKYEELWTLLNWARPGDYGSAQEWKQLVSQPLRVGQAHDATHAQLADARTKAKELVETILPNVFLRRMKTLIADQLPKKSDRVVFCSLTETQTDAYRNFIESDKCEMLRFSKEPCDCGSGKKRGWCCYQELDGEKWQAFMFPAMITLQKLANHVALILPQNGDGQEKQAKELDNLQLACPDTWRSLYRIKDKIFEHNQREFCGKWKVLKKLLDFWQANGDKVLIFSHSVRLLVLLKNLFDVDGTKYNFSYLDGNMSYEDRAAAVADFNSNPDQFVFLISTRAGGVGLNITSANKVVVVDPNWNPAYDLQAQDRAYRIGQTRDVEVFRLVSSGTIEEIVYGRQIYKQQQANIGYTASDERRYFRGVMDESGKVGELFGLANLFSFEETGLRLREIMHKTNVAETKAGVSALDYHLDVDENIDVSDEEDLLSNKSLGIKDDDDEKMQNSQMKKFAEQFIGSGGAKKKSKGPNPINAILAKAGVQYTHENSEVIGRSSIEAELGRRAMEVRNDLDLGRTRVFQGSQSQSQRHTSLQQDHNVAYSDEDVSADDVQILGAQERETGDFKINYKYRPAETIRRRQFCSMALMMGYQDPVEFALVVEDMTQDERRRMLDRFYRIRRKEIGGQIGRH